MRVLLVEDDALIAQGIVSGLRKHGMTIQHAGTAAHAEQALLDENFQALILDLGLPDRDGIELLSTLRRLEPTLAILILSARDAVEHRLAGLHQGADDYLVKPFDLRELAARLHALVRRAQGRSTHVITAGPLRLDPETGQAWLHDVPVELSRRELDLLVQLSSHHHGWSTPSALHEKLYGIQDPVGHNALNVHIHNIRRKLGSESIETARGLGYRLGWRTSA